MNIEVLKDKMTAAEKLKKIESWINMGATVYVSTALKSTKITPNTFKKWGGKLFKATEKSLYMARGKNWDCIDYCEIRGEK